VSQPRRNQDRRYRYPMHRVVAIIDDDAGLDTAVDALPKAGVDVAAVDVLSGPEGARLLDATGTAHGWRGRLLRLVQQGAYEGNALEAHERALNEGHHVIYVPVRGDDQRGQVVDVLHAAGGRYLLYFRRWNIDLIPRT
jgi:hypothetical protein